MESFPKIVLKPGREKSVKAFHPWIFSGAVQKQDKNISDGDVVEIYSSTNEYLATGHYNNGSIISRLFAFEKTDIEKNFWKDKILKAFRLREALGLAHNAETNVYRLVHGEGDGLPSLIIDIYNTTAVVQIHSLGMYRIKEIIAEALLEIYSGKLTAVYNKSSDTMPDIKGMSFENGFLSGTQCNTLVTENQNRFEVDCSGGQKTGFFIDQRENRALVAEYSKGKSVLNTFCYTGAFSVYAFRGGASSVHSVDSSAKAMELTEKNIELNGFKKNHASFTVNALDYIRDTKESYDLMILDPPAFAKHRSAVNNACRGYQRLNAAAFKKINPGGIVFTFSCSQVIDKELFRKVIFSAAAESQKNIRILHQLSQPADHPVNIYHPEGEYLKGLVLYVE